MAQVEHRSLSFSGGAQLVDFVLAASLRLVLFALAPAFGLIALLLLPGLLFLTFRKCGSASRHTFPLNIDLDSVRTISHYELTCLPARFARLACMTLVVVATATATTAAASTTASSAKTLAAAFRAIGFWFGLIDSQGPATEVGPVQCGNGIRSLSGIRHFDESEAARAPGLTVGDQCDLLHRAMRFEHVAEFGFGRAVRQVANVQIFHCNSSLNKPFKVV
jgi:hypothetical protein